MLSKLSKIKNKKDFLVIFKKGQSTKSRFLIVKYLKNSTQNHRFAFVVSLKISKKAVVRNKVRRRLSETVRLYEKKTTEHGLDVVFIALSGIEKQPFLEVKHSAVTLLEKIKI